MKKIALCLVFVIFIGVFSVGSILKPDGEFSENENRKLAQFPTLSAEKLISGRAQRDINTWFSHQLIFRDELISAKTQLQKFFGKRDIGGVYICNDGFYIEKNLESQIDQSVYETNLWAIEEFFAKAKEEKGIQNADFIVVPPASYILADKLPPGAEVFEAENRLTDAENTVKNGVFFNITQPLLQNREKNYYKTDHHWTTDGAYAVYKAYCESKGITAKSFSREKISTDFLGTNHSKVLDSTAEPDSVYRYKGAKDKEYKVTADGKTLEFGIYDHSKLEGKDKYAYFFGGNYGFSTVENCGGKGHLLIIKDSFANCFLPFLLPHYEKVTIIDPRYYVGSIKEIIRTENITDITVLYGLETLVKEKSVPAVLN